MGAGGGEGVEEEAAERGGGALGRAEEGDGRELGELGGGGGQRHCPSVIRPPAIAAASCRRVGRGLWIG